MDARPQETLERDDRAPLSPLWMVSREPALNELIVYLDRQRRALDGKGSQGVTLRFSRRRLADVRAGFADTLLRGERQLHKLCELFAESLLESQFKLSSTVFGRNPATGERFVLVRDLSREELYARTDLDLGNAQLERLRLAGGHGWHQPELVANFVDYEALAANAAGVHRVVSRIKAEEEIWNKVADEIFGLDSLVERDKQLRHLSSYVKDVFGVKIVVADVAHARRVQALLERLEWTPLQLRRHGIAEPAACDDVDRSAPSRLHIVEVKDYLDGDEIKASGWQAIKSVVRWSGVPFEIQVQTLRNHYLERSLIAAESHEEFKARREALRNDVARRVPLFGYYRDLLHWLFCSPEAQPPSHPQVLLDLRP